MQNSIPCQKVFNDVIKNNEGSHSSEVEHYVDIVGVTGSIPVVTTIFE